MFHPNRTTPNTVASRMLSILIAALTFLPLVSFLPAPLVALEEFKWGTKLQMVIPGTWISMTEMPTWAEGKWDKTEVYQFAYSMNRGSIRNPIWSPDGKWLAFNDYSKFLGIVSSGGGEPRMLWSGWYGFQYDEKKNVTGGNAGLWKTLCFTPDGKEVTFVKQIVDHTRGTVTKTTTTTSGFSVSVTGLVPVIYSINIETGAERVIADPGLEGRWSHDGKFFVYTKWVQGTGYNVLRDIGYSTFNNIPVLNAWPKVGAGIGIKNLETGKEWLLTDRESMLPCFSPDDAYVLLTMKDSAGLYQIYSIPREGGAPKQLTFYGPEDEGRNAYLADVSPDGEWLLHRGDFLANGVKMAGLCAFNLGTGKSFLSFPNADKFTGEGSFSGDNRKFAFSVATPQADPKMAPIYNIFTVDFQPSPFWKTNAVSEQIPVGFALTGNHPNPFNPSTTISFTLPSAGSVNLTVYDITGRKIRDLESGQLSAGSHSVLWDGRDANGKAVSSGVYLSRLSRGGKAVSRRMLLMK
ncbi:MAG: FlgD immunoglobulin-like domain containing protein [Candidatus Latescibacterota bacterium]